MMSLYLIIGVLPSASYCTRFSQLLLVWAHGLPAPLVEEVQARGDAHARVRRERVPALERSAASSSRRSRVRIPREWTDMPYSNIRVFDTIYSDKRVSETI